MHHESVDFGQPLEADALALLDRQGMPGRLQLDSRPNAVVSQVSHSLQVHGVRVRLEPCVQLAEEWANVRPLALAEASSPLFVARLAERDPDAPYERLLGAVNGDLQATADIEPLSVDDAVIGSGDASIVALTLRHCEVGERAIGAEGGHATMDLPASDALELECYGHGCTRGVAAP